MDLMDLMKLSFGDNLDQIEDVEKLDLSKKEDLDKFNKTLDELEKLTKDNVLFSCIINDDFIQNARKLALEVYNKKNQDKLDKEKDENVFPSSKIENVETKMQIHRLTQEYVDTMLKPYMEEGENTTNNINNAYTALYEFACWIYSHK